MNQNKQNLFQCFSTSIDQNKQHQENIKPMNQRKQRRASTYTKLIDKNISLDCKQIKDFNTILGKSFYMFKKCVSTEEIFYGKTSQQDLYRLLYNYLTEIIQNSSWLNENIKSMHFQQLERNSELRSSDKGPNKNKEYQNLQRILTQYNLAKSISIESDHTKKNCSAMNLDKHFHQDEPLSREISSIEQVESQKMQDSIKMINIDQQINMNQESENKNYYRQSSIKFDFDLSSPKNQLFQVNPSIQILQNNSSGGLQLTDKKESDDKMQKSSTSFGFEFQDKVKQLSKNLLQQVSLMYLNQSVRRNESQISLSIRESIGCQSSWFSDSSSDNISVQDIAEKLNILLSQQFLQKLYFEPQPFLITISLIYLLKYLYHSAHVLTTQSITILLATSLLVSYKIYEDLPIAGLVDFIVEDVLEKKVTKDELIKFERHFLEVMGYEVVIGNQQFYKMLAMIKGEIITK